MDGCSGRVLAIFALILALSVAGGCAGQERSVGTTDDTLLALAHLHGIKGDAGQRGTYSFAGHVDVTVAIRRKHNTYRLVVDSDTEPYILTFATGTCDHFTKTDSVGRTIYVEQRLPSDAAQGGDPGQHAVIRLPPYVAHELLRRLPTVFGDAGGAHNPDYLFCGALEPRSAAD